MGPDHLGLAIPSECRPVRLAGLVGWLVGWVGWVGLAGPYSFLRTEGGPHSPAHGNAVGNRPQKIRSPVRVSPDRPSSGPTFDRLAHATAVRAAHSARAAGPSRCSCDTWKTSFRRKTNIWCSRSCRCPCKRSRQGARCPTRRKLRIPRPDWWRDPEPEGPKSMQSATQGKSSVDESWNEARLKPVAL